ncbi:MAG: RecX family transcriptional regulator [candidate division WOR-3 bacterium]
MKISKIEVQKKNKKRSSIYIDGEFKFGLSNEILLKYDIKEGDELTEEHIKNLLLAEEKERLKQRAYRLLRYRSRSVNEMKQRLINLGYEQEIVDAVVQELIEEGALNDQRFVREFANDYTELKPKGNIFIMNELRKKKVDATLIEDVLRNRDEKSLIKNILQKKLSNLDKNNPKEKAKIIRRLLSKGFTPRIIYEVIGEEYE